MAESMVTVNLTPRGRRIQNLPKTLSTFKGAPVSEVVSIISSKTKLSQSRLKLTNSSTGTQLSPKDKIEDDTTLTIKDLGPQVSWRGVFICEYAGPLLIHPLIYFLYTHFSGPRSSAQLVTLVMIVLHFIKREYETVVVHRFSSETMPLTNLFKNCAHYWLIGGAALAAVTYSDGIASRQALGVPIGAAVVYAVAELSNYKTHCILRDLRPAGSTERKIPRGYGFNLVSCPNYFFEILAWCAISSVTQSWASWLFTAVGAVQMWFWSVKKHRRYKKEFKDYPKQRKILVPFVI